MDFAKNLRVEMSKANIGRNELADLTGISKGAISNYRNGKAVPGVKFLRKIVIALDCKVEQLI
jgi:transcriptional regulator with XRE-family HTH domain